MKGLLGATPNSLNKAKSTNVYTRASILKASKAAAKEATKTAKATSASALEVEPEITIGTDAQEEADRLNMFRLAIIGAKEGVAAGISAVVGTVVTDTTLRTADGQDFKTIDEYQLVDLI